MLLCIAVLAILGLGACSDSGGSSAPPAPPPFVPQTVSVELGESGDTVSLQTTQSGGFTRNGAAFATGSTIEAGNGNTYALTLQTGQWSAAYVAPDPQELALGISGANAEITRNEDGTYSIGESNIESGTILPTPVGSAYTLTLGEDGQWSAAYTPPDPVAVTLGSSGQTAQIVRQENGRFAADGTEFDVNGLYETAAGLSYRLSLSNGMWTANFVATAITVPLGDSGTSVSLIQQEDGSVMLGGSTVQAGHVVRAANGAGYELTFSNSEWGAAFLPDPQMVQLGGSGATVNITQLQDGSFRLNGQPFSSGQTHTAGNGSEYRLTFANGAWTVDYLAPPAVTVQLGASGETIQVERQETGLYSANGQLITDGSTYVAANGSSYRLQRVGMAWLATFTAGQPVTVALGQSGTVVVVTRLENGFYQVGNIAFEESAVFTAPNGNRYRVSITNGTWGATFEAPTTMVPLGSGGESVQLTEQEDGTYSIDGQSIQSGHVVTATNGEQFRLTQFGGTWTAAMLPPPVSTVALGNTGQTIMITTHPDGTYSIDGQPVTDGGEYTTPSGAIYMLTLMGDTWTAEHAGGTVLVPLGRGLEPVELTVNEDGSFSRNGRRFPSGQIVATDIGLEYRLTYANGEWTATLYAIDGNVVSPTTPGGGTDPTNPTDPTAPTTPTTPTDTDSVLTQLGTDVQFRTSGDDALKDEGTILVIESGDTDPEFAVDDLTRQASVTIEQTHAQRAIAALQDLIAEINTYTRLWELEIGTPDEHIRSGDGSLWQRAQDAVEEIFGDGTAPLDSSPWPGSTVDLDEVDDVVDELNDAIAALSSLSAFEDKFSGEFGESDGEDFYEADISKIAFGTTTNTRFGAFASKELDTNALGGTWTQGAFAYSPEGRPSSSDIPTRGEAVYKGRTVAVTDPTDAEAPSLYHGDIEVVAYFSRRILEASVTGLRDDDGAAWESTPTGGSITAVQSISLPSASLATRGAFNSGGGEAILQFPAGRGQTTPVSESDFDGQFVDEDREMFGIWNVGAVLEGSFGARYSSSQSADRPSVSDSGNTIGTEAGINVSISSGGHLEIEALNTAITSLDDDAQARITDLSARSSFSTSRPGSTLVSKARTLLSRHRSAIGSTPEGDEGALWTSVRTALGIVFGAGNVPAQFPGSYPTDDNGRDDTEARSVLAEAIAALGSSSRFRSELAAGELFAGSDSAASSIDPNDVSALFQAREYDFDIKVDRTPLNYTRFGAWSNVTFASAVDSSGDLVVSQLAKGVFAYSPLDKTVSTTVLSFEAVYGGETLAVDNSGTRWEGDFQLTVAWGDSAGSGSVSAFVENLKAGSDYVQHRELDVRYIQFFGLTASGFAVAGSPTASSVRYVNDRVRDATLAGTNALQGTFVGNNADGPLGVIGTWGASDLNGLEGAFGAELQP